MTRWQTAKWWFRRLVIQRLNGEREAAREYDEVRLAARATAAMHRPRPEGCNCRNWWGVHELGCDHWESASAWHIVYDQPKGPTR